MLLENKNAVIYGADVAVLLASDRAAMTGKIVNVTCGRRAKLQGKKRL